MDLNKIREDAKKELLEEEYRRLVELEKQKLRNKKSLWDKIFPYKIIILRKDNKHD